MVTSVRSVIDELVAARLVFWDFDGVIKESVEVKTAAFEELFLPHGVDVAVRVRAHHEANGGISRFQKMPLYLGWAGVFDAAVVEDYCCRFADLVLQKVVDSPWVPGVREYLQAHYASQNFVLLTATPQAEIDHIIRILNIAGQFRQVFGAPTEKADAIAQVLTATGTSAHSALMVGDAETDLKAAEVNGVGFLLRRTALNYAMHDRNGISMFNNLAL